MTLFRRGGTHGSRDRMRAARRTIKGAELAQPAVARPPGPARNEFLRATVLRGEPAPSVLERFAREYPPIAYIHAGPEHLYLTSDPDFIVEVFLKHANDTMKPRVLQGARSVLGDGLLTAEGEHHLRQRRLLQPAFHRTRIAAYADAMIDEAHRCSKRWSAGAGPAAFQNADAAQEVDMVAQMSALTLQIVGRTLFGSDLSGDSREVADNLEVVLDGATAINQPFSRLRSALGMPPFGRTIKASDRLDEVVQRMIEEHRASGDTGDLLSMMIAAQEDGVGMDDAQLRDEAMTLVLAGHETTAMWMTWTWLLLAQNPGRAAWLWEELDRAPQRLDFTSIGSLPRTRAVLAESLRLYPPAWIIGRKLLVDIAYKGWRIPKGSTVLAPPWIMHRHIDYWDYPLAFRPQRWLTDGVYDEKTPVSTRGAWFPFGWGKRQCIGDQFARTEATLLLAILARQWNPQLVDPSADVVAEGMVTLRPRGGLPMRLVPR